MRISLILFLALFTASCATTPPPVGPSIKYFLSTSHPSCVGLKDCQIACDRDQQGRACLEWALYALTATSSQEDLSQVLSQSTTSEAFQHASKLLQNECEQKDALSCLDLANLHLQGLGVSLDQGKALTYLDRACSEGVADGCTRLGMLYQEGVAVAKDALRARELFQVGCNADHKAACSLLKELN